MSRFILPFQSVFDANGAPLDGAKLYFYETGTSTPKDTYSDLALTIANANPVIADSQGEFGAIFLNGIYRVELKDKNDVTQPGYPEDNVNSVDSSIQDELDRIGEVTSTLTINIPTDYPDLQSAVDAYAVRSVPTGTEIRLLIETGHAITGGIGVFNGDYSHFTIESVDAIVSLAATFAGVPGIVPGSTNGNSPDPPLFYGLNSRMPQLKTVIDMAKKAGTGTGYMGVNSAGFVHPACGVINAGYRGMQWRNGYCWAAYSVWDGASGAGMRLHQTAHVNAFNSSIDDCCSVVDTTLSAVYVSRSSSLELRDSSVTNSGANGVLIRRSLVTAVGVDVTGANLAGLRAESSSVVDAVGLTAVGCGENGIRCTFSSIIAAHSATVTGNGTTDIKLESGGEVGINSLTETTIGFPATAGVESDYAGIDFFNVQTGEGLVVSQSSPSAVTVSESGGVRSVRHADGTQVVEFSADLAYLNTTQLFKTVSFPDDFLAVDGYSVSVCLPTSTGGWGIPGDRANVNFAGWSGRLVDQVTIVLDGSGFTNGGTPSSVTGALVTCTGKWK